MQVASSAGGKLLATCTTCKLPKEKMDINFFDDPLETPKSREDVRIKQLGIYLHDDHRRGLKRSLIIRQQNKVSKHAK